MRYFMFGSVFGALVTGATLAWAASIDTVPQVKGLAEQIKSMPVALVMAASGEGPDGNMRTIKVDKDGHVICALK